MTDPNHPQQIPGGYVPPAQGAPGYAPYPGQAAPAAQPPYPGQAAPAAQPPYPGQPGPDGAAAYAGAMAGAASPAPKKKRTGLLIGLIAGGVVLVLAIVAAVVVIININAANSPQAKVETMLKSVVDRDAEKAAKLLGVEPGPLLTNEFYAEVPNGIDSFTIVESETVEGVASVIAEVVQESGTSTIELALNKTEEGWAFDTILPSLEIPARGPLAGLGVTVNDADVGLGLDELATAQILPGDYTVAMSDPSGMVASEPVSASYLGFQNLTLAPDSGFDLTLTEEGTAVAFAAVDAHIDACIAQTVLAPVGCGWSVNQTPGETNTNIVWVLTERPVLEITGWEGEGWGVSSDTTGSADMDCNFSSAEGTGTCWADGVGVQAWGTVTDVTPDGATFTSLFE